MYLEGRRPEHVCGDDRVESWKAASEARGRLIDDDRDPDDPGADFLYSAAAASI
jgi:hypothetical protein